MYNFTMHSCLDILSIYTFYILLYFSHSSHMVVMHFSNNFCISFFPYVQLEVLNGVKWKLDLLQSMIRKKCRLCMCLYFVFVEDFTFLNSAWSQLLYKKSGF